MDLFQDENVGLTSTGAIFEQAKLHGVTRGVGENDHREVPDYQEVDIFIGETMSDMHDYFGNSSLEPYLSKMLSDFVNIFNFQVKKAYQKRDQIQMQQKDMIYSFDGSEISENTLADLNAAGEFQDEVIETFEQFREFAAEHFETFVGTPWMPDSRTTRKHPRERSASCIDANTFIKAKNLEKTIVHIPKGTPILFSGDATITDEKSIYLVLDKFLKRTPDMYLVTTGNNKGADSIALKWSVERKVTIIPFAMKGKGTKAPFDRNREIFKHVSFKPMMLKQENQKEVAIANGVTFGSRGVQSHFHEIAKKEGILFVDGYELLKTLSKS